MRLFAVMHYSYEDTWLEGIFSSREKAESYKKQAQAEDPAHDRCDYEVEEYELDKDGVIREEAKGLDH